MKFYLKGFTIIEFIIVIGFLATIYFLGIPNLMQFLVKLERDICLDRLKSAIEFTRQQAFYRGKTISLCGSHNQRYCHLDSEWTSGYIIFENENMQKQPTSNAKIIQIFPELNFGRLYYYQSDVLLHIHPTGMTMNFASFTYRPNNNYGDVGSENLVINRACRTYRHSP